MVVQVTTPSPAEGNNGSSFSNFNEIFSGKKKQTIMKVVSLQDLALVLRNIIFIFIALYQA